jgi:hypothetical protein
MQAAGAPGRALRDETVPRARIRKKPDKTHTDPEKAVRAAMGSFDILNQQAAAMGKQGFGAPDQGLLGAMAEADANVLDYDPSVNSLTLEVDAGKAQGLAKSLKKQGYTVAIDGVIQ